MIVSKATNALDATIEIRANDRPDYYLEGRKMAETLARSLAGGTWDSLLIAMLRREIDGYQQRGDDDSHAFAGLLLDVTERLTQRIGTPAK